MELRNFPFFLSHFKANFANVSQKFVNCCGGDDDDVFEEMTCLEIIDGKGDYFPGLAPLAYAYLDHIGCDGDTLARLSTYIELVRKKASGEAVTGAGRRRAHQRREHGSRTHMAAGKTKRRF